MVGKLGNVQKTLKVRLQFYKCAKVSDLGYFAFNNVSRNIFFRYCTDPGIFGHLFYAQADPSFVFIDFENNAFDILVLLQCLAGMIIFLRPAQIRNVYHAIKTRLHLYKRPKIRQTAYLGGNNRTGRILLRSYRPGVNFRLLDAKRYLLFFLVHVQNNDVYFIIEIKHLTRMCQSSRPAHLADMH